MANTTIACNAELKLTYYILLCNWCSIDVRTYYSYMLINYYISNLSFLYNKRICFIHFISISISFKYPKKLFHFHRSSKLLITLFLNQVSWLTIYNVYCAIFISLRKKREKNNLKSKYISSLENIIHLRNKPVRIWCIIRYIIMNKSNFYSWLFFKLR